MFELMHRNNDHQVSSWDPFREMEELTQNFFSDPFFSRDHFIESRTNVADEGDHYLLEAELPGFDKKEIHLELNGDILAINAQHQTKAANKDKAGKVISMERSCSAYHREFDVSEIDQDHIHAAYDNGMLRLTLPKLNPTSPKTRTLEIE